MLSTAPGCVLSSQVLKHIAVLRCLGAGERRCPAHERSHHEALPSASAPQQPSLQHKRRCVSDLVAVELAQLTRKGALKSTTAAGVQLKDDKQWLEFLTSNLPNNA